MPIELKQRINGKLDHLPCPRQGEGPLTRRAASFNEGRSARSTRSLRFVVLRIGPDTHMEKHALEHSSHVLKAHEKNMPLTPSARQLSH